MDVNSAHDSTADTSAEPLYKTDDPYVSYYVID